VPYFQDVLEPGQCRKVDGLGNGTGTEDADSQGTVGVEWVGQVNNLFVSGPGYGAIDAANLRYRHS
jgi:hypothetical protein